MDPFGDESSVPQDNHDFDTFEQSLNGAKDYPYPMDEMDMQDLGMHSTGNDAPFESLEEEENVHQSIPESNPASFPDLSPMAPAMEVPVEVDNELTKFDREWEEKLSEKAKEQERSDREWKENAKKAYERFYEERLRTKEARQATNRSREEAVLEKLADDLSSSNPWERVVTLIDMDTSGRKQSAALQPLSKKDKRSQPIEQKPLQKGKNCEQDCSRMRQILIQMKSEPLEKTRSAIKAH